VFGICLYFYIMSSLSCKYTRRLWSLPGVPKSQQQYFKLWISLPSTRTDKGVLRFQNVIEFHNTGLNVISFTPVRKERPSLNQFSRNSETLNSVIWRLHQSSRKSDNSCGIKWTEIFWRLCEKYVVHCTDFHETHNHSVHFYGCLLYWIFRKLTKV
jgi:hypothetical protein